MNQEELPARDTQDITILMHRDAHFGGQFEVMLHYYREGGKGKHPDFTIAEIDRLHAMEQQTKQNLAPMMLTGPDAEKVATSKEAYKRLRDLYDREHLPSHYPLLIADLILSEEEDPLKEIEAIVREGKQIVPSLLELLRSEILYDPLFPGYGQSPELAARCLGHIGDKRAIILLFESIGEVDFSHEDTALHALRAIGTPAKEFLLTVLKSHPITQDNERAATALIAFKEDPEIAKSCLKLLKDPEVMQNIPFATYLVLACEGLKGTPEAEVFLALAEDPATPKMLQQDIKAIAHEWK